MTRIRTISIIVALLIVAVIIWFVFQHHMAGQTTAENSSANKESSVLVKTQPLKKQLLPTELPVYGDVMPGKVEGISFTHAGQVVRLLVTPGQLVKQGTPLATLASDPNVRMAYDQAVNAVHLAEGEVKRTQELFALQLATQSQVDNTKKALQDAQANLTAQRQLGGNDNASTLIAPFDGVVTALSVAQGDRIQPGTPILQLGHTDVLWVQLGIEPSDGRLVKAGMPVTLASVQDEQQTLQATITQMQGLIDSKTQLLNALVVLTKQSARMLVPGMRVHAIIHAGQHESWALPRQAVLSDDQGDYIFQVINGQAHRVAVTKTQESQSLVAITGPVHPDQPVVVLGNYELQDGMKVRENAQ
jgi:membrane fusion protein (multidrug efflux system)